MHEQTLGVELHQLELNLASMKRESVLELCGGRLQVKGPGGRQRGMVGSVRGRGMDTRSP